MFYTNFAASFKATSRRFVFSQEPATSGARGRDAVDDGEADAYYASRSRESRLGAWASQTIAGAGRQGELDVAYADTEALAGKMIFSPTALVRTANYTAQYRVLADGTTGYTTGWLADRTRPGGNIAFILRLQPRLICIGFGA